MASALALAGAVAAGHPSAVAEQAVGNELRVCADPNNLPFSNDRAAGFENKLAEIFGKQLEQPVTYTWWAQRRGLSARR